MRGVASCLTVRARVACLTTYMGNSSCEGIALFWCLVALPCTTTGGMNGSQAPDLSSIDNVSGFSKDEDLTMHIAYHIWNSESTGYLQIALYPGSFLWRHMSVRGNKPGYEAMCEIVY